MTGFHKPLERLTVRYFFIDETNNTESHGEFFIVGGLILDDVQMVELSRRISVIREKYGYLPEHSLKFDTNSKPDHLGTEEFIEVKREIIAEMIDVGVRMIVYAILNKIVDEENREKYALHALLHQFDSKYLVTVQDYGVVYVDRFGQNKVFDILKSIFSQGVDTPSGVKKMPERIVHYSVTADKLSHLNSLLDIALGAFRVCVNSFSTGRNSTAEIIMPQVSKLIWHEHQGDLRVFADFGFMLYPKQIKSDSFRQRGIDLRQKLSEWSAH